jgi:hypothetical protein
MQLDILIVGVLFPAILLMMINFGNRYSLLAGLIRNLHDTVINAQTPADDSARFSNRSPVCANVCACWLSFKHFRLAPLSSIYRR